MPGSPNLWWGSQLPLVIYLDSMNSSLLRKCAFWNFDGKCLPFTLIAELFYKQTKIYGFRVKIIAKYETEKTISNKENGY